IDPAVVHSAPCLMQLRSMFILLSHAAPTTDLYTLSLHDALPIYLQTLFRDVASEYVHTASTPAQIRHLIDRGIRIALAERTVTRSEEHTSELQSRRDLVCRLLLEKTNHVGRL